MTNWKEYKLENIIKVKHGFAFKGAFFSKDPTNDILLSPGNFNVGGGFKADKFKYYNGTYPESYILKEGDIIVTMTDLSKEGDTLGFSAKIPPHNDIKYLHNQRLGLLQLLDNDFNIDFIYWLLRTRDYQQFIVSSATGTTVKHTSPTRICEYVFRAPGYNTQTAIAEILSSLDDKKELNNIINQELENLAQTLFKQWFIDFEFPNENGEPYKSAGGEMVESELGEIPENFTISILSEQTELVRGISYRKPELVSKEEGLPFVNLKCFALNGTFRQDGLKYFNGKYKEKHIIQPNDILVAVTDLTQDRVIIGLPILWNEKEIALPSLDVCIVRNENSALRHFLYYEFKTFRYKSRIIEFANGSTVLHLSVKGLETYEYALPNEDILIKWNDVISPILDQINNNIRENQELTHLRDTLLPKLISGELEVNGLNLDSLDSLDEKDFKKKADNNQGNQDNLNNQGSDK